jgi:hypothetical protein
VRTNSTWLFPLLVAACGGGAGGPDAPTSDAAVTDAATIDALSDAPIDAPPAADAGPADARLDAGPPPTLLSQTGLYSDIASKTVAADVHEFAPRWPLWSDAAVKRRWIWLPPGSQIDTSDADFWSFPIGTKFWKEFARNGARVETRYLEKVGATDTWADWTAVSFQWDAGETEGTAVPNGVVDAAGVNDIPSRAQCRQCHGEDRNPSIVIGFSLLQLDVPSSDPAVLNLGKLVADGRLSAPPVNPVAGTYVPLPADGLGQAAFGYLHANCGHCHNPRSAVHLVVGQTLRQDVAHLAGAADWAVTLPYDTTVGVTPQHAVTGATSIIEPGMPSKSALYLRLTMVGGQQMPPLGRETVDPVGSEAVRAYIQSLPLP